MCQKYSINTKYRTFWGQKMRQTMQQKRVQLHFRAAEIQKLQQSRQHKQVNDPVAAFCLHIQEGPIYTCVSCHRHLYKQSVVKLNLPRYKPTSQQLLATMLAAFNGNTDDQLHICCTCRSYVTTNRIPPQAAINCSPACINCRNFQKPVLWK